MDTCWSPLNAQAQVHDASAHIWHILASLFNGWETAEKRRPSLFMSALTTGQRQSRGRKLGSKTSSHKCAVAVTMKLGSAAYLRKMKISVSGSVGDTKRNLRLHHSTAAAFNTEPACRTLVRPRERQYAPLQSSARSPSMIWMLSTAMSPTPRLSATPSTITCRRRQAVSQDIKTNKLCKPGLTG